ncbi:MAG: MepB family protein [Flavobacteriales bacterium]
MSLESNKTLFQIKQKIYDPCEMKMTEFENETESQDYFASRFALNGLQLLSRNSKLTPKKIGQFVTFWKRNKNNPIEPFHENDSFDFLIVNTKMENRYGQFVFPKAILIRKGILSTERKEGKRGFRVYPSWDIVSSKLAERTQKWQLNYFYEIDSSIAQEKAVELYKKQDYL